MVPTIRIALFFVSLAMATLALPYYIPGLSVEAVRALAFLANLPATLSTNWDPPARTIAVTIHGKAKYGLCIAGIASTQNVAQGMGSKLFLGIMSLVTHNDAKPQHGW